MVGLGAFATAMGLVFAAWIASGRSVISMAGPAARVAERSMTFCNSRTLPGQG